MANRKKDANLGEDIPQKQSIEEVVEEAALLRADAELQDEEEQKKAEEEAKIPEVEVDLDEEREKTKREVVDSLEKEVIEPLRKEIIDLKKVMSPEEKDDYDQFVEKYTKENGEAPQWKQVAFFLEERAVNRLKQEQKQEEESRKSAEEETRRAAEDQNEKNFQYWQSQLSQMEEEGLIPKQVEQKQGDPGFDARVKLYAAMQNTWNKPGATPVTNMYEVHQRFYKDDTSRSANRQPAGWDAPTDMGGSVSTGGDDEKMDYNEIHQGGRDLDSFIARQLKKIGLG